MRHLGAAIKREGRGSGSCARALRGMGKDGIDGIDGMDEWLVCTEVEVSLRGERK
jgi:hypothetical protein